MRLVHIQSQRRKNTGARVVSQSVAVCQGAGSSPGNRNRGAQRDGSLVSQTHFMGGLTLSGRCDDSRGMIKCTCGKCYRSINRLARIMRSSPVPRSSRHCHRH